MTDAHLKPDYEKKKSSGFVADVVTVWIKTRLITHVTSALGP